MLQRQPGSRFLDQRAVDHGISVLEQFDGMAGLRNGLRKLAIASKEWAGIPMVMEGCPLVIEPSYPKAEALMKIRAKEEPDEISSDPTTKVRNRFWSWRKRRHITIWEQQGKVDWGTEGAEVSPIKYLLDTLNASDAWGIEQEKNAIDTLGTLLRHRQFKQYLLTGMFMEKSDRSGMHYLFRRLRPTIAISTNGNKGMRAVCALCLHPIGYYEGSWAGAMTPTDDVVAHLMLMRGDEHMFWKRANQHPVWVPQAGLS